jgi:hypothetical protein
MPREANAIDFWRGFALVTIFVNHIPGIYFERLTYRNLSISDSAELFVFLAGWSLRYAVGDATHRVSTPRLLFRLGGRALQIYIAQIVVVSVAIAILAGAALVLSNPLILEWHNAAAVFYDPVETHIGLAMLTHQLGYFDILPLYVVLMLAAPVIALIDRYAPRALLPLSLAIYFAALVVPITVPSWPVAGQWFFNPLAWQLIFVLGFTLARADFGLGAWARTHIKPIRWVALPIVVVSAVLVWFEWWPDPTKLPEPRLLFINGKTFLTPMRLIQFLMLIAVFSAAYPYLARAVRPLCEFLSLLGRNALYVFCVASILSLLGQIARFAFKAGLGVDTVLLISGVSIMVATAWMVEWRERSRSRA